MKRILQIAATSLALLLVLAVASPVLAASTCPTANTSPINNCLAKYKLTASDIDDILNKCGLTKEVLRYGPVCETGDCTTPDCTKVNCDGTECITTDCTQNTCANTGSASEEQSNSCTEADCAANGCDAADCLTAGCKDTCAQTKCAPVVEEEPAEEATDDTQVEAVVSDTDDSADVQAVVTEETQEDAEEVVATPCPTDINDAIAKAKEAIRSYTSSNCPTSNSTNKVESVPQNSSSNCPTGGSSSDARAQIQDAVSNALNQARTRVSSSSNCPTGSGSVDVNGILNQLQNSGLYNCNK